MSTINEQKLRRCCLFHVGSSQILREIWVLSESEIIKVEPVWGTCNICMFCCVCRFLLNRMEDFRLIDINFSCLYMQCDSNTWIVLQKDF